MRTHTCRRFVLAAVSLALGLAAVGPGFAQSSSLALRLRVDSGTVPRREVALQLEALGAAPVQVRNQVAFQREVDGVWRDAAGGLLDRTNCAVPPRPACIEVPAGGVLTVEPWDTMSCRLCECGRNVPVPGGRYRAVVQLCGTAQSVVSEPFTLPPR